MTAFSGNSTHADAEAWPDGLDVEAELVRLARGGCPDSFRKLVEQHQQPVYRFCYHYLQDFEEAREACQDTFVRAHRALPRFRPRARFGTWLFRIALNLCRDRTRVQRKALADLGDHEVPCGGPRPDDAAMRGSDLGKLERGLQALPPSLRAVLVLSCLDARSHAECAAILKCSERAVEGRLYRARKRLAHWWETDPG